MAAEEGEAMNPATKEEADKMLESNTDFVSFGHAPDDQVCLDGDFTANHLRALIWLIEHRSEWET